MLNENEDVLALMAGCAEFTQDRARPRVLADRLEELGRIKEAEMWRSYSYWEEPEIMLGSNMLFYYGELTDPFALVGKVEEMVMPKIFKLSQASIIHSFESSGSFSALRAVHVALGYYRGRESFYTSPKDGVLLTGANYGLVVPWVGSLPKLNETCINRELEDQS